MAYGTVKDFGRDFFVLSRLSYRTKQDGTGRNFTYRRLVQKCRRSWNLAAFRESRNDTKSHETTRKVTRQSFANMCQLKFIMCIGTVWVSFVTNDTKVAEKSSPWSACPWESSFTVQPSYKPNVRAGVLACMIHSIWLGKSCPRSLAANFLKLKIKLELKTIQNEPRI